MNFPDYSHFRIIKAKKAEDYTVMSNYHLRDMTISLEAKGLLSQMLSLPDDWHHTIQNLAAINKEHSETLWRTIKELEQAGYVVRRQRRKISGKWTETEYDIYEIPLSVAYEKGIELASSESADTESKTPEEVPASLMEADKTNEYQKE